MHQFNETGDRETALSLARAGGAIYRRCVFIMALPLLFAAVAGLSSFLFTNKYDAVALLQVDARSAPTQSSGASTSQFPQVSPAIWIQVDRLGSRTVIDEVIKTNDLQADAELAAPSFTQRMRGMFGLSRSPLEIVERAVRRRLSISEVRKTNVVAVRFTSRDPEKSARIANAVVDAYLKLDTMEKSPGPSGASFGLAQTPAPSLSQQTFEGMMTQYGYAARLSNASVVSLAQAAANPSSPKRLQWMLVAGSVGLVLALTLALLLETATEPQLGAGARVRHLRCGELSSLPAIEEAELSTMRTARLVVTEPSCRYARAIHETIRELDKGRQPGGLVLVTSSNEGEGSEHVASNIAHELALRGGMTLLVDGDVRSKSLTRQLQVQSVTGLLDQLAKHERLEDAVLRDSSTGLHFLPASGQVPVALSASDALKSPAFDSAIASLRQHFDTIVVSAPPLLPVIDSKLLAERADQIVFVTSRQKTPPATAEAALRTLGRLREKVSGAVVTDTTDDPVQSIMRLSEVLIEACDAVARMVTFGKAA